MPDIFLSYSREDLTRARHFAHALAEEGFDVWWDVALRSGEAYDVVTEQALKTAKAVIVLWSPRSVVSRWVRSEATQADRRKTLVPAMIEACERPVMFELTQTAELTNWHGDVADAAWQAFIDDVRRIVKGPEADTPQSAPSSTRAHIREIDAPPRPSRPGEAPLLAVLPFRNRSNLAEDEVFAFGMVEDLTDALATCGELRVVASSVTARFAGASGVDVDGLVRQLGVRYLLEGNVRRVGTTLMVTAQAIDATVGAILWSQRFDCPLDRLASLQEDLVMDVAHHLQVQTTRLEVERALRKPADLTAWEGVMRVIACARHLTGPSLMTAIREARNAVQAAPDYAPAQAFLAMAEAIFYDFAIDYDGGEVDRIRTVAEKALTLDANHPQVLYATTNAFASIGLHQEAMKTAQLGLRVQPNFYLIYNAAGRACTLLDRCDEAIAHFDREQELAPGHLMTWISELWRAVAHVRADRWERAEEVYDGLISSHPDQIGPNVGKAVVARKLGRLDDSRIAWDRLRRIDPDSIERFNTSSFRHAYRGNPNGEIFLRHLDEMIGGAVG